MLRSNIRAKDYWHNIKRDFDHHCHPNLTRAIMPWGLREDDVHNVINMFQVTYALQSLFCLNLSNRQKAGVRLT